MSGPVERERRASNDDVRSHIVNSLFWRKAEDGTPEETLISFTKVYEEDPGDVQAGAKTRYLMLAGESAAQSVLFEMRWAGAGLGLGWEGLEMGYGDGSAMQRGVGGDALPEISVGGRMSWRRENRG
jgi:hypothetical protein